MEQGVAPELPLAELVKADRATRLDACPWRPLGDTQRAAGSSPARLLSLRAERGVFSA